MEELAIEIDCLEAKKNGLQLEIVSFTEHGRFPADHEFVRIGELSEQLNHTNAQLEVLVLLQRTINSNSEQDA